MDRKKTQRILGILVILALATILFPLLLGKNEPPTQITSVQAPPFPEQQEPNPVVANEAPPAQTNPDLPSLSESSPEPQAQVPTDVNQNSASNTPAENQLANPADPATKINALNNTESRLPDTITNDTPTVKNTSSSIVSVVDGPVDEVTIGENVIPVTNEKPMKVATSKQTKIITPKKATSTSVTRNDLAKLNNPAWAIQIGSFKDRDNARNLADKLRAAGYNAFIKEVKSTKGNIRTRVYVGPEFKQANAYKISAKIQQEMNLQGIVISYKPLTL